MEAKPYQPIASLSREEVDSTLSLSTRYARLWAKEKNNCFSPPAKLKFYERWGIELGLIEDIFHWDRGVTMTLLEQGISPEVLIEQTGSSEQEAKIDAASISSHVKTLQEVEMGFVIGEIDLSAKFIRELQEKLLINQKNHEVYIKGQGFARQKLVKGVFKKNPNDPSEKGPPHEKIKSYCPPEDTLSEVIKLCDIFKSEEVQCTSPEVRSAWLHHRFTQIHPFDDGNGRVARTLASLVLVKAGLPPLIVRRDEDRSRYLDALEAADQGDLRPLVGLFLERIRDEILHLITASDTVPEALEAARRTLLERIELRKERADYLFNYIHAGAKNKFSSLTASILEILDQGRRNVERFTVENTTIEKPGNGAAHAFDNIVESQQYRYKARVEDISGYIRFIIVTDYRFSIIVHLHERDVLDGGGFVIAAFIVEEGLNREEPQIISKIPIEPLIIGVEKSRENTIQNQVVEFSGRAVELGVSIWGRSL